jgi:hypothetical protein
VAQRFYFHFRDGDHFIEDEVGVVLGNLGQAINQAEVSVRELLDEQNATLEDVGDRQLEVCDEDGYMFVCMPLRDFISGRHASRFYFPPYDDVA